MAKEIAIGKRAKISQAQQYMLLSVLGASVALGVAIACVLHFFQQISFNTEVIIAEDQAIKSYSNAIRDIGVCPKPKGDTYTTDELKNCDPDSVSVASVPDTLRSNILENLAANTALNSVPKENTAECLNSKTNKNYTYSEMYEKYNSATSTSALVAATRLIRTCSALRVIPDALPNTKNEEALLASLNKIFYDSGWEPNSLSPSGDAAIATFGTGLNTIAVRLAVEADSRVTRTVLSNIERSIREFNINRATIEYGSDNTLILQAQATAYYTEPTTVVESTKNITSGGKK